MKTNQFYTTVLLLYMSSARASTDPYDCDPDFPKCKEKMTCVGRTIEKVEEDNKKYQKKLLDDPSVKMGTTSHWCIPEDWLEGALSMSGKWDDSMAA